MTNPFSLSLNPLVRFLKKAPKDFTRNDLIRYIEEQHIEMLNFRYVGGDGRLKTLNFVISDKEQLIEVLSSGERVDGSSLFPYIEAGNSDLYVVPRFRTAFLNPFSDLPTLDILCSFYDKNGNPYEGSPEYILQKAHQQLKEKTGFDFEVMGELEYYVISEKEPYFVTNDQRGYHESTPFTKWEHLRREAMHAITSVGGNIKYGHSEVGNFTVGNLEYEQNEIEFKPCNLEDAADQLIIGKWILRSLAHQYGVTVTFAPKITVGKAGSGLHIHTRLMKDGVNQMIKNGKISDSAKKAISGYLDLAPSLTAFGNTNPTSYFRLVPHQEAPTNICWGDRNRSVLVRVPLGWSGQKDMLKHANPIEEDNTQDFSSKQTVEFRCPDGSADIYLLLAGLTVAARHGFEMKDSLAYADKTYVDVNIFEAANQAKADSLKKLPVSCFDSALALEQQKAIYLKYHVFEERMLDGLIAKLKAYQDQNLREEIGNDEEKILRMVDRFFHCG
ncbi:MAG: glutamine synthetase [Bacteroidales bacterium]|nr:glutamine synthetase [Bacteroidales bacterium]